MTGQIAKATLAEMGAPNLVYVREVPAREILEEVTLPSHVRVDPNATWYAVHASDGERLAVLDDRAAAFEAAREHEYEPVSVH